MAYEEKEFLMDRETLHELVGPQVSRDEEMLVVMERIKGKEIKAVLRDENFARAEVRGILLKDSTAGSRLLLEDWKGNKLPDRWSIKVLELKY